MITEQEASTRPESRGRKRVNAAVLAVVLVLGIWLGRYVTTRPAGLPPGTVYGWYGGWGGVQIIAEGQVSERFCPNRNRDFAPALGTNIRLTPGRDHLLYWSETDHLLCRVRETGLQWSSSLPVPQVYHPSAVLSRPTGAVVAIQEWGRYGPQPQHTIHVFDDRLVERKSFEVTALAADASAGELLIQDDVGGWSRWPDGTAVQDAAGGWSSWPDAAVAVPEPPVPLVGLQYRARDGLLVGMEPTQDQLWSTHLGHAQWTRLVGYDKQFAIDRSLDLVWTSIELPIGIGAVLRAHDLNGKLVFKQRLRASRVWPLGSLTPGEHRLLLALPSGV